MTMETIKADFDQLKSTAKALSPTLTTSADMVKFLQTELVPFLEAFVDEGIEMDGCIADLVDHAEDILQPDTAKVFAAVIVGGGALIAELEALLPKDASGKMADPAKAAAIAEWKIAADAAGQILEEITMPEDDEDEDDGEGEDDEDDDDSDEGAE